MITSPSDGGDQAAKRVEQGGLALAGAAEDADEFAGAAPAG